MQSNSNQKLEKCSLVLGLSLAIEYGVTWKTMKTILTKGVYMKAPPALADRPQKHGHPSRREVAYYQNMTI